MRQNVDVYVGGQRVVAKGVIAEGGGLIRITGDITPIRFTEAKLVKTNDGTVAYVATAENGERVGIAALSSKDCGCGHK